jgi:hypothetical protein
MLSRTFCHVGDIDLTELYEIIGLATDGSVYIPIEKVADLLMSTSSWMKDNIVISYRSDEQLVSRIRRYFDSEPATWRKVLKEELCRKYIKSLGIMSCDTGGKIDLSKVGAFRLIDKITGKYNNLSQVTDYRPGNIERENKTYYIISITLEVLKKHDRFILGNLLRDMIDIGGTDVERRKRIDWCMDQPTLVKHFLDNPKECHIDRLLLLDRKYVGRQRPLLWELTVIGGFCSLEQIATFITDDVRFSRDDQRLFYSLLVMGGPSLLTKYSGFFMSTISDWLIEAAFDKHQSWTTKFAEIISDCTDLPMDLSRMSLQYLLE